MDTVHCTTDLWADQYVVYTNHRMSRTKNVTFPSLKKYSRCLMNESSGVERPLLGVSLPSKDPGRLVCISPRLVL